MIDENTLVDEPIEPVDPVEDGTPETTPEDDPIIDLDIELESEPEEGAPDDDDLGGLVEPDDNAPKWNPPTVEGVTEAEMAAINSQVQAQLELENKQFLEQYGYSPSGESQFARARDLTDRLVNQVSAMKRRTAEFDNPTNVENVKSRFRSSGLPEGAVPEYIKLIKEHGAAVEDNPTIREMFEATAFRRYYEKVSAEKAKANVGKVKPGEKVPNLQVGAPPSAPPKAESYTPRNDLERQYLRDIAKANGGVLRKSDAERELKVFRDIQEGR